VITWAAASEIEPPVASTASAASRCRLFSRTPRERGIDRLADEGVLEAQLRAFLHQQTYPERLLDRRQQLSKLVVQDPRDGWYVEGPAEDRRNAQ